MKRCCVIFPRYVGELELLMRNSAFNVSEGLIKAFVFKIYFICIPELSDAVSNCLKLCDCLILIDVYSL